MVKKKQCDEKLSEKRKLQNDIAREKRAFYFS